MDTIQGILEASPDAVLLVDDTGMIQRANRNAEAVLGYSPQELEDMVVEDLLREADRGNHVRYRQEYMDAPEPRPMGRELDLYALHKDGRNVPVEISLGPIEQADTVYVLATIVDISKRKQRERELERQNERLEEFASIVSHDLRNPLNVAQGEIYLAKQKTDSKHHENAERALARMEDLIADLLTLARDGAAVTEFDSVDLSQVVQLCWENVDTVDATLVNETDLRIRGDTGRLRQLFENLIRNAVEHGSTSPQTASADAVEDGGTDVTVTVGDLASGDGFFVADDGPGIPEAKREQVFESGFSTRDDGTGFGLTIVREIVEAHGWELTLTRSENGGARFEITGVEPDD